MSTFPEEQHNFIETENMKRKVTYGGMRQGKILFSGFETNHEQLAAEPGLEPRSLECWHWEPAGIAAVGQPCEGL